MVMGQEKKASTDIIRTASVSRIFSCRRPLEIGLQSKIVAPRYRSQKNRTISRAEWIEMTTPPTDYQVLNTCEIGTEINKMEAKIAPWMGGRTLGLSDGKKRRLELNQRPTVVSLDRRSTNEMFVPHAL